MDRLADRMLTFLAERPNRGFSKASLSEVFNVEETQAERCASTLVNEGELWVESDDDDVITYEFRQKHR